MKVTVIDEMEFKTAFDRNKYCCKCGSHMLKVHHLTYYMLKMHHLTYSYNRPSEWYIECEQCGHEGKSAPTYELAMLEWKNMVNDVPPKKAPLAFPKK